MAVRSRICKTPVLVKFSAGRCVQNLLRKLASLNFRVGQGVRRLRRRGKGEKQNHCDQHDCGTNGGLPSPGLSPIRWQSEQQAAPLKSFDAVRHIRSSDFSQTEQHSPFPQGRGPGRGEKDGRDCGKIFISPPAPVAALPKSAGQNAPSICSALPPALPASPICFPPAK